MAKPGKKDREKLLLRIHERYKTMTEADRDNRSAAMDDLKFALVPGHQWTENEKRDRGDRPAYEFNKIRVTGKRIVNSMRANRPQGKVRAVEDGDKKTAEAMEGICRNIWAVSDGDTVSDYAAEYQVFAGMGAWRVVVDYADDDAFEQDIRVEALQNPFCLYADPAASDPVKRDAMDWMLTERISKSEYERRWPKAEVVEFEESEFDDAVDWQSDEMVRICEYWYKEPVSRTIMLLSDGRTIGDDDLDPETAAALKAGQLQIVKSRDVKAWDIYMCIASGDAIVEGPVRFAGKHFPFIVIYGEWTVVDGAPKWCGITRFAKDAQRSYNYTRTAITETIASAPQAKYVMTPEQLTGHEANWQRAHAKNFPFLLYNADPKAPGAPQRMGGADVPVALIQEMQIASEEIKAVTGIFDASLGSKSNETSGRAINARQAQGEIATFNYQDNLAKGIKRTWEILIDLIPRIYDTQRQVRILGVDGADKTMTVNAPDPQTGELIDLSRGKYDCAVTVGPSFGTQRQEAAETYMQLVQANPAIFPLAGDLIFKSMDLPYSDQISERLKAMLPPQIQALISGNKPVPPEVQAIMAQAEQAMAQVQQQSQLVQQAGAEVEQGKAEVEKAIADLETKRAQFEASVATKLAQIAKAEAALDTHAAQSGATADRGELAAQVADAVSDIQALSAQFMQQAAQTLAQMETRAPPVVIVPPKQRIARIESQRIAGKLIAIPIYESDEPQVMQ